MLCLRNLLPLLTLPSSIGAGDEEGAAPSPLLLLHRVWWLRRRCATGRLAAKVGLPLLEQPPHERPCCAGARDCIAYLERTWSRG